MTLAKNQIGPQMMSGPKSSGPFGPPRKSVVMTAANVIAFMNSAR